MISDVGTSPLRQRVARHLDRPLQRNAYALVFNTAATGGLGLLYWVIAARVYPTAAVGRAAALISTMQLVSTLAQLNLGGALTRFVPVAGRQIRSFVSTVYLGTAAVAVVLGVGTVLLGRFLAGRGSTLDLHGPIALWFVVAVTAWGVFALQDSVLTGLGAAVWVPAENVSFGVVKIVALVVLSATATSGAIFASWTVPVAVSLLPVNLLIFRRLVPRVLAREVVSSPLRVASVVSFATRDFLGSVLQQAAILALPMIVASRLGNTENAYFYAAITITVSLEALAWNFVSSFIVEGARSTDREDLAVHFRSTARSALGVTGLAVGVVVAGAPLLLSIYGRSYGAGGATVLRLMALAVLGRTVTLLYSGLCRVHHRMNGLVAVQALIFAVTIGGAALLLPVWGLTGVGVAVLLAQLLAAGFVVPAVFQATRSGTPRAAAGTGAAAVATTAR